MCAVRVTRVCGGDVGSFKSALRTQRAAVEPHFNHADSVGVKCPSGDRHSEPDDAFGSGQLDAADGRDPKRRFSGGARQFADFPVRKQRVEFEAGDGGDHRNGGDSCYRGTAGCAARGDDRMRSFEIGHGDRGHQSKRSQSSTW